MSESRVRDEEDGRQRCSPRAVKESGRRQSPSVSSSPRRPASSSSSSTSLSPLRQRARRRASSGHEGTERRGYHPLGPRPRRGSFSTSSPPPKRLRSGMTTADSVDKWRELEKRRNGEAISVRDVAVVRGEFRAGGRGSTSPIKMQDSERLPFNAPPVVGTSDAGRGPRSPRSSFMIIRPREIVLPLAPQTTPRRLTDNGDGRFGRPLLARRNVPPPPVIRIDRDNACPFLLRVYSNEGSHAALGDFEKLLLAPGGTPENGLSLLDSEIQVYTWRDGTLKEITELLQDLCPEWNKRNTRFNFRLVKSDKQRQRVVIRPLGSVQRTRPGADDHKTLMSCNFDIGDVLSLAIITPNNNSRGFLVEGDTQAPPSNESQAVVAQQPDAGGEEVPQEAKALSDDEEEGPSTKTFNAEDNQICMIPADDVTAPVADVVA